MNGPTNHEHGHFRTPRSIVVIVCSTLAIYNALGLLVFFFCTFHTFRGLYLFSMLFASFGVLPYAIGYLFEYFELTALSLAIAIDSVGWILMVTGQSVALYPRLGLILGEGHRAL
jgi:hypothetical protein